MVGKWLILNTGIIAACKLLALYAGDLVVATLIIIPASSAIFGYVGGMRRSLRIAASGLLSAVLGVCLADAYVSPSTWPRAGTRGDVYEWVFVAPLALAAGIAVPVVLITYLVARYMFKDERVAGGAELRCQLCGYLLVGLDRPRCPECGTTFRQSSD